MTVQKAAIWWIEYYGKVLELQLRVRCHVDNCVDLRFGWQVIISANFVAHVKRSPTLLFMNER